jgi:SAM-dependent methyltransferase
MSAAARTRATGPATHAHGGEVIDRVGAFEVIECEACGFRHVEPLPSAEELTDVYRHEYYDTEKPLYLARHDQDRDWLRLSDEARYRELESGLAAGRRRIVDVGCGPGHFLALGRERGWQGLGIEPSRQAAAHARELGVEVVEDFLTPELGQRLGCFDAAHLSDVLEHLPDPRALLETCHGLLSPGGMICVSVPNDYNPLQAVLREGDDHGPWWLAPPHHLNYFDFDSLRGLLERSGFEVLRASTSFPMELFALMGERYVGNDAVGRQCHERRMRLERLLCEHGRADLLQRLYGALAELGIGRHVTLFARRG